MKLLEEMTEAVGVFLLGYNAVKSRILAWVMFCIGNNVDILCGRSGLDEWRILTDDRPLLDLRVVFVNCIILLWRKIVELFVSLQDKNITTDFSRKLTQDHLKRIIITTKMFTKPTVPHWIEVSKMRKKIYSNFSKACWNVPFDNCKDPFALI